MAINLNSSKSNAYKTLLTSVNSLADNSEINIYPNPSSGKFQVRSKLSIGSIDVYNMFGEKIYSSQLNSVKSEIDLSNKPGGVYFIHIHSDKENVVKKIILQK